MSTPANHIVTRVRSSRCHAVAGMLHGIAGAGKGPEPAIRKKVAIGVTVIAASAPHAITYRP